MGPPGGGRGTSPRQLAGTDDLPSPRVGGGLECLVLTATPGRGDDNGLLELLKLVAPTTYGHMTLREFADRLEPQRRITEKLLYSEELDRSPALAWQHRRGGCTGPREGVAGRIPNDPIVVERLARMEDGDGQAAQELVAHIQEHYRVDRRIIRTRRRTLAEYGSHYATRNLECLEYDACPAEVAVVEQVADLVSRTDVPDTWKSLWSRRSLLPKVGVDARCAANALSNSAPSFLVHAPASASRS